MFSKRKISQYVFLFLGVTFNIGLLCFFKYSIFIAENIALIKGINLNQEACQYNQKNQNKFEM